MSSGYASAIFHSYIAFEIFRQFISLSALHKQVFPLCSKRMVTYISSYISDHPLHSIDIFSIRCEVFKPVSFSIDLDRISFRLNIAVHAATDAYIV